MTPHVFLAVLDDALRQGPPGRRAIVLETHSPSIPSLGQSARFLRHDDEGPVYGYTRRQCIAMRDAIYAAAREDAGL